MPAGFLAQNESDQPQQILVFLSVPKKIEDGDFRHYGCGGVVLLRFSTVFFRVELRL